MKATLEAPVSNIARLKIDNTDIFLEDLGEGKGKITISDTYGHNYSTFWGAMGMTLKEFICEINDCYFTNRLLGATSSNVFDAKNTITEVRRHIREELGLPWYTHKEFQVDMRERLNSLQETCEDSGSENTFVDLFFSGFINRLDFYLIEGNYEQKRWKSLFESIDEPWHFIQTKESQQSIWLRKIHAKLKKELKKI